MIKSIYKKYFQKSKSFLYPALGIKKNSVYTPSGTYLAIPGLYGVEDVRLICTYDKPVDDEKYNAFEEKNILSHPLFLNKIDTENNIVYIFNYDIYMDDWFNFIAGKYSKLSIVLKKAIRVYFGESSVEYKHLNIYLNPKEHFDLYAKLLNTDVEIVNHSGELCDEPNLEKESLRLPQEILDGINKTT